MTPTEQEPQLQSPGAGLPSVELFISRLGFRFLRSFTSRAGASRWFRAEADRILELVRSVPPANLTKRVLIPRVAGLEDSSRFWSVCMTLEHLVIVDSAIAKVVEALAAGVVPPGAASTADVKPGPSADANLIGRFETISRDYLARVDALPNLGSKATYRHPWFGPLTAAGWHCLSALHHRIHRKQLERIVRLLPKETPTV